MYSTNNNTNKSRKVLPTSSSSSTTAAAAANNNNNKKQRSASSTINNNNNNDNNTMKKSATITTAQGEMNTKTSPEFRDRCNLFGIECEEYVVWRRWQPGGEYTMSWRIKNLSDVGQVISYKLPNLKATFFIEFPEPVTLATGNIFELKISFRPNELTTLTDQIEVTIGKKGAIYLNLVAVVPYQQLAVPEKLDLGLVAVGVETSQKFEVKNVGTAEIDALWEVNAPFYITNNNNNNNNNNNGAGGTLSLGATTTHRTAATAENPVDISVPAVTRLAPGESQTLIITVAPSQASALVTRIVCRDQNSKFCVGYFNVSAVAKFPFIMSRENTTELNVDFGSIVAHTATTKVVNIDNTSMVPAHFSVARQDSDVINPFTISPMNGIIPRGGKIGFQVRFKPDSPGATYRNVFHIRVQGGNVLALTLSGTATGASLSLSSTSLDFGDVPVFTNETAMISAEVPRKAVKKLVTLRNTGNVPAEYLISQCGEGNVFVFESISGVVGPNSTKIICVSFLPPAPINYLRRVYIFVKDGEAALAVDLFGTGYSPKLRPAPFQLSHVKSYWARIDGGLGRIAPEELAILSEKLRNPEMQNLEDEDEVAALSALAVSRGDLGMGYSSGQQHQQQNNNNNNINENASESRSVTFGGGGVQSQRSITVGGGGGGGGGGAGGPSRKSKTGTSSVIAPRVIVASGRKIDTTRGHSALHELPMLMTSAENAMMPFSIDESFLVFRQPGGAHVDEQQIVTVYNHTASKATAYWAAMLNGIGDDGIAKEMIGAGEGYQDHEKDGYVPWSITPAVADIPPHGSTQFLVSCNRNVGGGVTGTFAHFLECFVAFKQMRTFRLVSDDTFSPPLCLTLECQRLVPMPETSATPECDMPTTVAFPAQLLGHSSYQVISITNLNETFMSFNINIEEMNRRMLQINGIEVPMPPGGTFGDIVGAGSIGGNNNGGAGEMMVGSNGEFVSATESAFSCFPTHGSVPPKQSALVIFRFRPAQRKRYRATAVVSINDVSFGSRQISLRGEGFVPQLLLADNGALTFRPAAVGARNIREYRIHNPSRVNVEYFFEVPEKFADIFRIEPPGGVLGPNEQSSLQATFAPGHVQKYETRIPITVRSAQMISSPEEHEEAQNVIYCTAFGEGCTNILQVEPINLNLGEILCGSDSVSEFTIFNVGICDVYFEVRALMMLAMTKNNNNAKKEDSDELDIVSPNNNNNSENNNNNNNQPQVRLEPSSGFIRARSHVRVLIKTRAISMGTSNFSICVVHHGSQQIVKETEPSFADLIRLPHVNVQIAGSLPTLEFCDVRCTSQRKSRLWRQMSFDAINAQLTRALEPCDSEKDSFDFAGAITGLQPVVCDIGVDVIRTAPIRVMTCVKNKSPFPVKFSFWFADQQVGTDDLAQLEDADKNSASLVADRNLFSIEPREGTIPAGGDCSVIFSYKHSRVGSHATPVILQIENGKRVFLHLAARTLGETEKFLSFHFSREHTFAPVAIGDMEPPLQYIELQNVGYEPVSYNIDNDALQDLRERNGDFPIMQCLNPQGTVPPLSTLLLCWCFRPLEKKRYEATIQIQVEDCGVESTPSHPLKLIGEGYHPAKLPLSEVRDIMADKSFAPIPAASQLKHELAPIQLSWDVLKFGVAPMHSLHRRLLVLRNTHPRDTFIFEWNTIMQFGDHIVEIDPPRGRIRPGESVTSRVSLYAGSTAQIIDLPVSCFVLNEDLRSRRLSARALRSHQAAESLDVQAETEEERDAAGIDQANQLAKRERNRLRAQQRISLTTIPAAFQSAKQLRLKIKELTDAAAAEELSEDDPRLVFVDVVPAVVEVLLQAHIVDNDTYTNVFGVAPVSFFPTLAAYATPVPEHEKQELLTQNGGITADEFMLGQEIVAGILQQVVHHKKIRDATADISEDPVPFFYEVAHDVGAPNIADYQGNNNINNNMNNSSSNLADSKAQVQKAVANKLEQEAAIQAELAAESDATDGFLRCLAEEIAEQLIFDFLHQEQQQQTVNTGNNAANLEVVSGPGFSLLASLMEGVKQ